ncbi:MAG TPA: hypothetical protein VGQ46_17045 [Thermoanaerobaculia bacterium]|nr:hypothetical protein [Thermoanaerobaculia bacterium]
MIDQTLTGRTRDRSSFGFDMQIAESDVVEALRSSVAFVNALYEHRDRGQRLATFYYGAAAAGMNTHLW